MGVVGHFDLFILRLDSAKMQFKCAACKAAILKYNLVFGVI